MYETPALAAPRPRLNLPWFRPRRGALGLAHDTAPALVFVLAGVVLGPALLDVISNSVLAQLDPVVSVALAVLGIFIGSGFLSARGPGMARLVVSATSEASVTLVTIVGAMYLLFDRWLPPLPVSPFSAALVLGCCAAASASVHAHEDAPHSVRTAAHLADFDDLPVVVCGGVLVTLLSAAAFPALALGAAFVAALMIAAAASLLVGRGVSAPERLVFVSGTVLLLGGAAAYSSVSPLLTGALAGLLWTRHGTPTASLVESDLRRLQRPLVGVLLVFAGASVQFSVLLLWVAAPLVLFRLAGKLLGSLIASRIMGLPPGLVATILAPPGVLGIALALNVQQVIGTADTILVSAVTVATVVSELLATTLLPEGDDA